MEPSAPTDTQTADAGISCQAVGNYEDMIRELAGEYSETAIGRGIDGRGLMAEVVVSPQGTWTWILVSPDGAACIIAVGASWQFPNAAAI